MRFLFDEDTSPRLARALTILGESVQHVQSHPELGKGTPDDVVFRVAADRGYRLISRDRGQRKRPHELALIKELGLGAYYLHLGKKESPPLWEEVKLVVKRWEEIKIHAENNPTPYTAGVYRSRPVKMWKYG